jgi:hypothetical protein
VMLMIAVPVRVLVRDAGGGAARARGGEQLDHRAAARASARRAHG